MKSIYLLIAASCLMMFSCKSSDRSNESGIGGVPVVAGNDEATFTSVYEGVPVYKQPDASLKDNWISGIKLGETVYSLDEKATDPADSQKEFVKVKLSDGKEGWARSYGLVENSKPAVVINESKIYDRPDLLALSNKAIPEMTFIAITKVQEDFVEFVSEQKKFKGWMKKDNITESKEDVVVAVMAIKEFAKKDNLSKEEKLAAIIANAPYPNSIFVKKLNDQLEQLTSDIGMEEEIEMDDSLMTE